MTSHPDNPHHALAGCGQRLKQAREAAGMSIDDVAARLHMPARIVRSLEAEDWSRLGAPVFVRGQVRSYSRLMGLVTAPMMEALDIGPVEPSRLVSRTHTPKAQWWAEQIGRRLVYIVLTLFLVVPAWVATRQHLSNAGDAAPLDLPVDAIGQAKPATPATPRTVVASMAPVAAPPAAANDIVIRTRGESWITVTGVDARDVPYGVHTPDRPVTLARGDELGMFHLGSTAVVFFEPKGFGGFVAREGAIRMGQALAGAPQ